MTALGAMLGLLAAALIGGFGPGAGAAMADQANGVGEHERDLPLLSPECEFTTEGKVVVVGDVFTDMEGFLRILAAQNLIDHNNNWIGEDAHLVQTGNIWPRDRDWNKLNNTEFEHEAIARYLMKLQKQARAQGGDVHSLQGMLETLFQRWRIDLIPIGLEKIWAGPDGEERADALHERWLEELKPKNAHFSPADQARLRKNLENYMKAYYQPGCVELLERYGKYDAEDHRYVLETEFAQWFRSRNTVIKINDVLYTHTGISPKLAGLDREHAAPPLSLKQINDLVRERNNDPTLFLPVDADLEGPIWWKGMVEMRDGELRAYLDRLLPVYDARAIVLGVNAEDKVVRRDDAFFVRSGLASQSFRIRTNTLVIEAGKWQIIEERRVLDEGMLPGDEVLPGGPEEPQIPGGERERMDDPGAGG